MEWKDFDKGVFLVNVLGIVYNSETKKILIGRRENDPYIKELTWCFPGGRPGYEGNLESNLRKEIKGKTNLDVKVRELIFARTYPERREFLSLYYLCDYVGGEVRARGKFKEVKWVQPTEVSKYRPYLHPKVLEFLKSLEKGEL